MNNQWGDTAARQDGDGPDSSDLTVAAESYLQAVEAAIADSVLTEREVQQLGELARRSGLTDRDVAELHRRLLDRLHATALADDVLTSEEHRRLVTGAALLGMDGYFDDLQPTYVTGTSDSRAHRTQATDRENKIFGAASQWARSLVDVSGRNRMLYHRDLKAGTLDLTGVDPRSLARFLSGAATTIRGLFPEEEEQKDAVRRVKAIRKSVQTWAEERGVDVGHVARGFATWSEGKVGQGRRPPCAPVLLFPVSIKARTAAASDFTLEPTGTPILNPALLHVLEHDHGVSVDSDTLLAKFEADLADDPTYLFDQLLQEAGDVSGFEIEPRVVLGTFVYAKLPMVQDIENAGTLLTSSDVIAALAGDSDAVAALQVAGVPVDRSAPDATPPRDEFLVCDADSSQSYAINSIVAGHHMVIKGPPGTGKSQTIANTIATLAARGRSVLFVAEKRAAIEAVVERLKKVGIEDLVLDLHGGSDRRRVTSEVEARLARVRTEHQPQVDHLDRLQTLRDKLTSHMRAMHETRDPWEVSAYEAQANLIGLCTDAVSSRLSGQALQSLDRGAAERLRQLVEEYTILGGHEQDPGDGPWADAVVNTVAEAEELAMQVTRLANETVPDLRDTLEQLTSSSGLRGAGFSGWKRVFDLLDGVHHTLTWLHPSVYTSDPRQLMAATANRRWRKRYGLAMGWRERRRARQHLRDMWRGARPTNQTLHEAVARAAGQQAQWSQLGGREHSPTLPEAYPAARHNYYTAAEELRRLDASLPSFAIDAEPSALERHLDDLAAARPRLMRMARRKELHRELHHSGLRRFLEELRERRPTADEAARAFDYLRYASILDQLRADDPSYGNVDGRDLDRAASEFQRADSEHIRTTPARVRRAAAARLVEVLDAHPEQESLVRKQAARKRGHLPVRDFFRKAPQALLAIKPCWAMSPLMVSQVLPPERHFDVVLFDEASQVPPVDGVPAIMRGRQAVVAGDEHQLPPTRFFATEDEELETDDEFPTGDVESLLESLAAVLPFRQIRHLAWHYRSQDERLIAFSNRHIYAPNGNELVTFPGARIARTIVHVQADGPADGTSRASPTAEVDTVVRLVLDHAQNRPHQTLGVITMGIRHADRIQSAIDAALARDGVFDGFFAEDRAERFFVKNIERVQGDERDAIILSVGYGKGPDGRMIYRFGPINNEGGHRRLNVAVTRARRQLTVVSSFGPRDLDPNRLRAYGAQLLRAYLEYAESGGKRLDTASVTSTPTLNPFEADIRDRLTAAGIPLVVQHGASSYRIDFAAQHPDRPGQMVLAIEADGASYHSTPTARERDRLRQQHLERLGWRFHRIWSTDWFRDPAAETERARAAYDQALADADAEPRTASATTHGGEPAAPQPRKRGPKPHLTPGLKIDDYTDTQILGVVLWIEGDGILRTSDQLLTEVMQEMGFQRRGARIVTRISTVVERARKQP